MRTRDTTIVVQTARWDRLKDPAGVLGFFADHLAAAHPDVHLLLVGPSVDGVADDPEDREVLGECVDRYPALPSGIRDRVHLACSPVMDEETAEAVINALRRRPTW